MLFKELSAAEETEFREHAEQNDPPANWRTLCHPVCQEVWIKRGFNDREPVTDSMSAETSQLMQAVARINGTCARLTFEFTTNDQTAMELAIREFCDRILDKVHLRPGLTYSLYGAPGEPCGKATIQAKNPGLGTFGHS